MVTTWLLILGCVIGAADPFSFRIETLRFHLDRLNAIEVSTEFQVEKDGRLQALRDLLNQPVQNEAELEERYNALDAARSWLLEHAVERPSRAEAVFRELDTGWMATNGVLRLELNRNDFSLTLSDNTAAWRFLPGEDRDVVFQDAAFGLQSANKIEVTAFHPGYGAGMQVHLTEFPPKPDFSLWLTFQLVGSEMVMDLAVQPDLSGLQYIDWPKAIQTDNQPAEIAVIPRMQGMLLPGNWEHPLNAEELFNSRSFYMPWWGHLRGGSGILAIVETPDDAGGVYRHPAGGPTRVAPRWYASLGTLRYARTIRYVLQPEATHVSLAKRYRRAVIERGDFVSLKEKAVRNPALNEVIGRPVIHHGSLYHFVAQSSLFNKKIIEANHQLQTFDQLADILREYKKAGIDSAYVHLDGWGFYGYDSGHPDPLPVGFEQGGWAGLRRYADTCRELGYFFAIHDNYRDFYLNALSYDDRMTVTRLDGSREEHSTWCGGPQTILNPRFAPEYVRRNHDLFAQHGISVRGTYIDVFSVVPLEESAVPGMPLTRSDCARYRRQCFEILRARGYVVSSEEGTDYLAPVLDLVHHAPYATYPRIGGGDACGIPVPLFNLVYHDALLIPWEMGNDGGWGIPKGDSGQLHCLLNAGLPYVYGVDPEAVKRVNEAADLARHCAFSEMVSHEFLGNDYRKQRTVFSDGTEVTVNFSDGTYTIHYP